MLIEDFDKDKNGVFNDHEIKIIEKESFSNLEEFHYFIYIFVNGKKRKIQNVKDFTAKINNKKVVYIFTVPCNVKAKSGYNKLKIAVYDKSIYTDICFIKKNPVKFVNASLFHYEYKIKDNTDNFYFDEIKFPFEVIMKFRVERK